VRARYIIRFAIMAEYESSTIKYIIISTIRLFVAIAIVNVENDGSSRVDDIDADDEELW
jgi:hypothetical protein